MKSVRISHSSKMAVKLFDDGTYDENINKLIDTVADYMPLVDLSDESSLIINLKEDTVDKLNSYRLTNGESFDNILVRMLIMAQGLNSIND